MPLERELRQNMETASPSDKHYFYTAADTTAVGLTILQQVVRIGNAFAFTLSLPSVAEAAGLTFTISVDSATAAVTLTDFGGASYNDSINWEGDYTLDAAEDRIVIHSNGREWTVLENQIA